MKILAINASYRGERGFTQVLIEKIKTGATDGGAEFETIVLAECRINQCLGCDVCHTDQSYLKCVYDDKDDIQSILQKIREADLVIYATPIYIFNMSGLLKRFIERINSTCDINKLQVSKQGLFFHHIDKAVCSKPFVLLTTCGNIENETSKNAVTYFKTFARFMDAPMAGTLVRTASFLLQKKDEADFPKKMMVLNAFQAAGRDLALMGKVSNRNQKRATQNVIQIPTLIGLLMKIKPLRGKLLAEGIKKNAVSFK